MIVGTFETVANALVRRNHLCSVVEASTGNRYRIRALAGSLRKQPNEPGYNPGLRFAECLYVDRVSAGIQGYIYWVVPNPDLLLYTVVTTQLWNPVGNYWRPNWVNGLRQ